jgi:hypothetical protein
VVQDNQVTAEVLFLWGTNQAKDGANRQSDRQAGVSEGLDKPWQWVNIKLEQFY